MASSTAKGAASGAPGGRGKAVPPRKITPPEGGWGWCVVFAFALNNIMTLPLLQTFGLIFKDKFRRMNMTAADCTTIINANLALTFGLGLLNGPLLRRFTYRKLAITGSFFLFSGAILTGFASTFTQFIVFYSITLSFGFCFMAASFNLALSSYFRKLRGRATGLGVAITGLGPIFMPFLISYLLNEYAVQGTMLIMAGLVLHSLAAALLLQPVRWHVKPQPPEVLEDPPNEGEEGRSMLRVDAHPKATNQGPQRRKKSVSASSVEHDLDAHSIYGCEDPLVTPSMAERCYRKGSSVSMSEPRRGYNRSVSQDQQGAARNYWWTSVETVNLGSSYRIFDERSPYAQLEVAGQEATNNNDTEVTKGGNVFKRAAMAFANFFDLDLLKDPVYVSIMLGMSVAIFGELNFSMLIPFILSDYGFSTQGVAKVMSTAAGVDIAFRFMVPFIAERFKIHPRLMYISSLILAITNRSLILSFNSPEALMGIAVSLGIAKGIRTVYNPLIIPTYVPLERLPGASGIQMLMNGLVFTAGGPLLGAIRDYTGSYSTILYCINGLALFTVLVWLLEYLICKKGFQIPV